MLIQRAYKTELDPNNEQCVALLKHASAARFAYNWGLARHIEEYKATGKSSSFFEQSRQLTALKKSEFPWMYEISKCAPESALRDLERAFANFFRRVRLKKQGRLKGLLGFPKFKSKKRGVGSFRLRGHIHIERDRIKLPRLGWLRLKERGYIPTEEVKINSATVSERAGRWFVSVQGEEEIEVEKAIGPPIGVDLGIKAMATCSDGVVFENPEALHRHERKLARLQRELCRRKKGSRNREKTRRKIAKLHYRIANVRKDAIQKATHYLTAKAKPSAVIIEDLNVSGMLKNGHLSKAISDAGFYEFRRQLEYKARWYGVDLVLADRFYPSSKTCSSCGSVKPLLKLSERTFVCEICGCVVDRDYNAALNLESLAPRSGDSLNACGGERLQGSGLVLPSEAGTEGIRKSANPKRGKDWFGDREIYQFQLERLQQEHEERR